MRLQRIRYFAPPGADYALAYQRYYLLGLSRITSLRVKGLPLATRFVPGLDRRIWLTQRLAPLASMIGFVGRYIAADGTRFAIDARDNHAILPNEAETFAWSDVYFKANRWPSKEYDAKVRPIVNGNGILGARQIELLRGLRNHPKDLDLVFIANVWGGREHVVSLFEKLAEVDGPKVLRAIFPAGASPEEDEVLERRLRAVDVETSRTRIPSNDLWRLLARARVVPMRWGKHMCIPWRMLDLLAMGACTVFDAPPLPQWPVPLLAGVHYADLGIDRSEDAEPADSEYAKVVPTIKRLLADDAERQRLAQAGTRYFDEHGAPEQIARYVLRVLTERSQPNG